MDQPEHQGSNCLLGGNSKEHAMFGVSCIFENLDCHFSTFPKCLLKATRSLNSGNYASQLRLSCCHCYGFYSKYTSPIYSALSADMPDYKLRDKPGILSVELLVDWWHYAVRQFVHDKHLTKEEVKDFFAMLHINKSNIYHFMLCCYKFSSE